MLNGSCSCSFIFTAASSTACSYVMSGKPFGINSWALRIEKCLEDKDAVLNDVCLKAKDSNGFLQEIYCSKLILSLASPVFRKKFFGALEFSDKQSVDIEDGKYETLQDMIQFIYCEKELTKYQTLDSSDKILSLLELSYFGHKYQISSLTNYTSYVINNNIVLNLKNVIAVLQDVEKYKLNVESECCIIENFCFNFLDVNMRNIFFDFRTALPKVSI